MAELAEAAAMQDDVAQHRLALEWGHIMFAKLLSVWMQIEARETLAYEDKVSAQVRVLDEAAASLWHLRKHLLQASRRLKQHRQHLRRSKDTFALKPVRASGPTSAPTQHTPLTRV